MEHPPGRTRVAGTDVAPHREMDCLLPPKWLPKSRLTMLGWTGEQPGVRDICCRILLQFHSEEMAAGWWNDPKQAPAAATISLNVHSLRACQNIQNLLPARHRMRRTIVLQARHKQVFTYTCHSRLHYIHTYTSERRNTKLPNTVWTTTIKSTSL